MVRCAIDKAHQIHFHGLHLNVFSTSVQLAIKKKRIWALKICFFFSKMCFALESGKKQTIFAWDLRT